MAKRQGPARSDRLHYAFDNFMSRGTTALIIGLAIASAVLIIGAALFLAVIGDPDGGDLLQAIWQSFLHTIDSGYIGGDQSTGTISSATQLVVTVGGLFVVAILIGIIGTGIQTKLEDLRKGRSRVIENGHVVILGWNQQIFAVLGELIEANSNRRGSTIAVLADMDKVAMEDAIHTRITNTRGTRIVCRSGNPIDLAELDVINVQTSRSIIVLAPPSDDPDADVLKVLLAIVNDPARRQEPYHVVAEIRHARNLDVARMVGKDEVEMVLIGDVIARITAQTCRQPGLSVVYTELLDFEGDEIYTLPVPELTGRTFGEALHAFDTSALIGLMPHGATPQLNPGMDVVISADDKLVVISRDDDTVHVANGAAPDPAAIVDATSREPRPERTLVLGWNWRAHLIVAELDNYVTAGSEVLIIADEETPPGAVAALDRVATNQRVTFQAGDITDRQLLDAAQIQTFNHVIILSYSDKLDVQRADGKTLVALLHLRDIAEKTGQQFSIVSEMLDLRNRALAEVTRADDFIVSDRLVSLYLSQVAENKSLAAVFADLFDADGSEVYVRPATDYVAAGKPMTFYTVVEAARLRGEVAIGYRLRSLANDSARAYGVVVNPKKSDEITFSAGDRVIVLAEE
jgi:voltage-gated potassium channel Kch